MGYVLLLHRVIARDDPELRFKHSYDITLAGSTITRLLPTAGLGGAAVTVWALRARGMRPRELTERLLAFMLLLYAVYMAALLSCGTALAVGLVHVSRGQALGLVAVAVTSAIVTVVLILPSLGGGAIRRIAGRPGRVGVAADRVARHLPALRAALQRSWREVRRPSPALLGALAWWGFDIGVLAAMLHAFGVGMQIPVIVLAYFLGTMFNVMPLPGSLSGGLVAVLIALGAPAAPALAAVLAYRTIAVWLPAASGIASLTSLRSSVAGWRAAPADAA